MKTEVMFQCEENNKRKAILLANSGIKNIHVTKEIPSFISTKPVKTISQSEDSFSKSEGKLFLFL